ncbi:MAG: ribbon-helix-helix protein, CopG family [Actinobacteria bacterium]|nr:ribbon-helix-helix protein, CopG family [Actinomycetota bacterium]
MPVTITTRVSDNLAKLIDKIAKNEGMDRSTVLRRFLEKSTKNWFLEKSLKEYQEGKLTLRQAAKISGLSLWEIIEEVKNKKIYFPYTIEDLKDDLRAVNE